MQHYLKLSQETLYISISLLDTILEKRDVEPDKLQLVGITALYLGSKMEEYYPADVKKLLHLTENSYAVRDVFDMELVLLGVISFQVKRCHDILNRKSRYLYYLVFEPPVPGVRSHPQGLPAPADPRGAALLPLLPRLLFLPV